MSIDDTYLFEIIEKCKKNDSKAQMELYRMYYKKMLPISLRYSNSIEDTKDIIHDCFILIFDKIKTFKGEGSFEGWMKRIIINKSIDFIKKKRSDLLEFRDESELKADEEPGLNESEEKELVDNFDFTANQILSALTKIKESYSIVFKLYIIDEMSHIEIGEKLGITDQLSRVRLKRAREAIKKLLLNSKNK